MLESQILDFSQGHNFKHSIRKIFKEKFSFHSGTQLQNIFGKAKNLALSEQGQRSCPIHSYVI